MIMRKDDPRLAYNTPPLHPNCRSILLSVFDFEYPEGHDGDPGWDNMPEGVQRPEDIEAVRELLMI